MDKIGVLKLVPNKNKHYSGGRELDRFRGIDSTSDDDRPEGWVGSTTHVLGESEGAGLALASMPDGSVKLVKDLISESPLWYLGKDHVAQWKSNPAFLVKLLDAGGPLTLQCHPSNSYAKLNFNAEFGKEESWYIISLRDDAKEPPYIILGFKPGITRQTFERYYDLNDIDSMKKSCHKILVKPGDMFIVPPGVPHAIGPGCFLAEVQQPSDITVFAVKSRNTHHQAALGCFDYKGRTPKENLKQFNIPATKLSQNAFGSETLLLGPPHTSNFAITKLDIAKTLPNRCTGALQIGIVLEGKGCAKWSKGELSIQRGDELLIAAGVTDVEWFADEPLSIFLSHPPGASISDL